MVYNYQILQLNEVPENHGYFFTPLDWFEKFNLKLSLNRYKVVYIGSIESNDNISTILEKLFTKFNINHPEDFKGHSLSVSDVVYINNEYYYCDDFGWKLVNFNS